MAKRVLSTSVPLVDPKRVRFAEGQVLGDEEEESVFEESMGSDSSEGNYPGHDESGAEQSQASVKRASLGFTNRQNSTLDALREDLAAYFSTNPDQGLGIVSPAWSNVEVKMPAKESFELFKPQDLAFEPPYTRIVGMLLLRDILENSIMPAMQHPEEYDINGNTHGKPLQQAFYFYGKHGSGIRTLVRSFCHSVGCNLIVASHPGFDARTDLKALYDLATENQPCIVLMIDTDVQFGANSPNVTMMSNILEAQRSAGAGIWTIFRSELRPGSLAPQIQELIEYSVWAELPNDLQRVQLFALALDRHVEELPPRSELKTLAILSMHCTARNIFRAVRASVCKQDAKLNKERHLLSSEQRAFSHNDVEIQNIPGVGRRLTLFDPGMINAAPYQDFLPHSAEPNGATRRY